MQKGECGMTKNIRIEGMSCGHCAGAVREELEKVAGVSGVSVDLQAKTATVTMDGDVSDEVLAAAVTEAGYEAVGITG